MFFYSILFKKVSLISQDPFILFKDFFCFKNRHRRFVFIGNDSDGPSFYAIDPTKRRNPLYRITPSPEGLWSSNSADERYHVESVESRWNYVVHGVLPRFFHTSEGVTIAIDEELGQGAHSKAYSAHLEGGETVVVKQPRSETGSPTEGRLEYTHTASLSSAISKSTLVTTTITRGEFFSYRVINRTNFVYRWPYAVETRVSGVSLFNYLSHGCADKKMDINTFKCFLLGLLKALDYLWNQKGLVHLDLNSGNIMFDAEKGSVGLVDLGKARVLDRKTYTGRNGTKEAASLFTTLLPPEVSVGASDGTRFNPLAMDVWSLGIGLFQGLTGQDITHKTPLGALLLLGRDIQDVSPSQNLDEGRFIVGDALMRMAMNSDSSEMRTFITRFTSHLLPHDREICVDLFRVLFGDIDTRLTFPERLSAESQDPLKLRLFSWVETGQVLRLPSTSEATSRHRFLVSVV